MILIVCKDIIKGLSDCPFRHSKARSFYIRTVAHQGQYALLTQLGKPLQINRFSEYRCIIHLEVSGMHQNTGRCIDCQCRCICNAVVCLDKFHTQTSQINDLSMLYNLPLNVLHQVMFL